MAGALMATTRLHRADRWNTEVLPIQKRWIDRFHHDTWGRLRRRAVPVTEHIRDHGFSWTAMGCVDAACFVHSLFTGLLVTGILLFLFELKISGGE
jgi:hypothetical protein